MLKRSISKAGWTRVAFGDLVRKVNDRVDPWNSGLERYVAGEHMETDDLRIRRWGLIGDDYLGPAFHMRFKPGHVLYGSRRTYLRKVALADFEGITANTTFVLETMDSSQLMPDLLPFLMQTEAFHSYSIKHSKGSVNPYINFSDLESFEFLLPPIQEQARLVEALIAAQHSSENIFALVEATRVAQIAAFEELLRRADAKPVTLGSIMTAPPRNGYSPVTASRETGHWVLALSAISKWGYRYDQLKPVEAGPETIGSRINKGDLVISRSNTRDLVGLPMVFPEARSDVSYPDTMMRISVDPKTISPSYLEMCLRSPKCRRQVQSFAAGTSSSMLKVNGANLRKINIALVAVSRQVEILANVARFTDALAFAERRFEEARKLQIGIVNGVLGGVVTA